MSTTPRLPSSVEGEAPSFATVMGHAAGPMARFGALYAEFWQHGRIDPALKEMTRLRNARITDCGY